MRTRDEDFVGHLFVASTHAYIMIFSDRGRAYWLKVHEIPDVGPGGKGKSIANLVSMEASEKIAAMLAVKVSTTTRMVWDRERASSRRRRCQPSAIPAPGSSLRWGSSRTTPSSPCRAQTARAKSSSARARAWRYVFRKPMCGRWGGPPTACAALPSARTTTSWPWRSSNPAAPCSPSPSAATASAPRSKNTVSSHAAASA